MKKIFVSVLLLLLTINAFSQTEKGNYTLGGSVSIAANYSYMRAIGSDVSNRYRSIDGSFLPTFGTFVVDNLILGVSPSFSIGLLSSNFDYGPFSQNSSSDYMGYGLETYITKYFGNEMYKPFVSLSLGYNRRISNFDQVDPVTFVFFKQVLKDDFLNSSISGGLGVFVNQNLSLNLYLQYRFTYMLEHKYAYSDYYDVSNNLLIGTGVSVYFSEFKFKRD